MSSGINSTFFLSEIACVSRGTLGDRLLHIGSGPVLGNGFKGMKMVSVRSRKWCVGKKVAFVGRL